MAEILFLSHRIPYPPNKGDKIRSWNLLQHLAERHTVSLGCFIDDAEDWAHVDRVRQVVAEASFCALPRSPLRVTNLAALGRGLPISVQHYRSRQMLRWIREVADRRRFDAVLVYSSNVAQYATLPFSPGARRVIDFVDVDSDKWRQYAQTRNWPERVIYERESRTLASHDRRIAESFDACLFVSEAEAELFGRIAPAEAHKNTVLPNGIDAGFFDPDRTYPSPFDPDEEPIVFTGAMDYWANVDAVVWFAESALPAIRRERPNARFWVVGAHPARAVTQLAQQPGISVTGRVDDVRPYLRHAGAVVAPLRIARGVQNKVLEGMSMGRPVVATPAATAGLSAVIPGSELHVANDPDEIAVAVTAILQDPGNVAGLGKAARARILESYAWSRTLGGVEEVLGVSGRAAATSGSSAAR